MVNKGEFDIEKLIQKDESAFSVFYEEHVRLFYQFGMRFINDFEVVRDIVQDAFVVMWHQVGTFKEEAHVKAFLYTAIRNKAISYLRHQEVEGRRSEELLQLQDQVFFRNITIEEEFYDFLCRKIDELPPMQREVLWMSVDGFSSEEIANRLNISVHTVHNHKQLAKAKLKVYLSKLSIYLLSFM